MTKQAHGLFQSHPRSYASNRYVYPVLSRRASGLSIGVNINPDKSCNFNCIYCQVDRSVPGTAGPIDLDVLRAELEQMVELAASGRIFEGPQFASAPAELRRLRDIAISGDGEPTLRPEFPQVVEVCAEVRRRSGLDDLKLVLLTNGSLLHKPAVAAGLGTLDANNGEIWFKLDTGSQDFYRRVARSAVPRARILTNLIEAARARPIVIQTLLMRIDGLGPSDEEIDAYCLVLRTVVSQRGQIKLVQVHTIARPPAESSVTPLPDAEIDRLVELIRRENGFPVGGYFGATAGR
jgi:wyosine [tRNA(Phe)-imidazoG37] synthetase (radical SAM superfamily)